MANVFEEMEQGSGQKFRDFLKSGHTPTLFAAFFYLMFSFVIWVMNGAMAPFISEQFQLTPAQKGLLLSIPIVAGAIMRFPLGLLAQALAGGANWVLMGTIVWVLFEGRVDFATVLGALLMAAVAGVITHVPAGLGVLEAVFVATLSGALPATEVLAVRRVCGYLPADYALPPELIAQHPPAARGAILHLGFEVEGACNLFHAHSVVHVFPPERKGFFVAATDAPSARRGQTQTLV